MTIFHLPDKDEKKTEKAKEAEGKEDGESGEVKYPYPKSVFFIISTEFCERFSYYGMKSKYHSSKEVFWSLVYSFVEVPKIILVAFQFVKKYIYLLGLRKEAPGRIREGIAY